MKKKALVIVCCLLLVAVFAGASSFALNYKILLPNTKVYAAPSFSSEVSFTLQQNETVTLVGESFVAEDERTWQKIRYNDEFEGYILFDYLYSVSKTVTVKTEEMKITPDKMGEKVALYTLPSTESEVAYELEDGENVTVVLSDISYNGFVKVDYEGKNYFVAEKNVTSGLTVNQKIAVIIASAFGGIVICVVVFLFIRKKIQRNR